MDHRSIISIAILLLSGHAALAQQAETDPPSAKTAAELADALRAAGVELPEGFVVRDDGSVALPQPPADPAPQEEAQAPPPEAAPEPTGEAITPGQADGAPPEPTKPAVEWDNKIDLAAGLTDGNTETASVRAGYEAVRKAVGSELTLDASYAFSSNNGDPDQNEAEAGVNHDWLFEESRWIAFLGGRLEWDQFNSFRYRVSSSGGGGYKLIDNETFTFTPRFGLGFSREFGSDQDEIIPEGLLGADFAWQIASNQSFESRFRYFPALQDLGEFRTRTTASWRLDLDDVNDGLGLSAGLQHEHQSEVDEDSDQNDISVFAGVTWDF